jgi:Protein of unknown function (DUF3417)
MSGTQEIGIEALTEIALNLRWSWNRSPDELWAALDPELWAVTRTSMERRAAAADIAPARIGANS